MKAAYMVRLQGQEQNELRLTTAMPCEGVDAVQSFASFFESRA
jgi:hypothetical protein